MREGVGRLVAGVNAAGAALTLAFWGFAALRLPPPWRVAAGARLEAATTFAFGIADLVWAVPLLVLSARGLWRRTALGWTLAQAANVLWLYSLSVIGLRDAVAGSLSPGTAVFLPFALFAAWAAVALWRVRAAYWRGVR
jgi:hypothetical protein